MQSLKSFLRSTIWYFIPFLVMTVVAIVSQNYVFRILLKQNYEIIQNQLVNDLEKLEQEIYSSKQLSLEMSLDSNLSVESMTELGLLSIKGIDRIGQYRARSSMCSSLFIACSTEKIITEYGISSFNVFCDDIQYFSEQDSALLYELMEKRESVSSILVERGSNRSILFLYYYPENISNKERWIGFFFDDEKIAKEMQGILGNMDSHLLLTYDDQKFVEINQLTEPVGQESLAELYDSKVDGKSFSEHTLMFNSSKLLDMKMYVLLNNSVYNQSVRREQYKLLLMSVSAFVILTITLWGYGKIQYKKMQAVEKIAIDMYPELDRRSIKNNYDLIQTVLEKDLERINYHNQILGNFRRESKKQLTWLLLKSIPPEDLNIDWLIENCGINENGSYYCVLEFLLNKFDDNMEFLDKINKVIMYHVENSKQGIVLMVVIAMNSRDGNHEERTLFAEKLLHYLSGNNNECKRIASGLVYERLTEIHSSQDEAFSLLSTVDINGQKKKVYGQVPISFFDEYAGMAKRVPHITAAKLEEFREVVLDEKYVKATELLDDLFVASGDRTEELRIYIRYKIIQIILDVWKTQGSIQEKNDHIFELMKLEGKEFQVAVRKYLEELKTQASSKNIDSGNVLIYIRERALDADISIIDIADHFGISKRSVARIINDAVGKNYKEYISEIRLIKTYELLQNDDLDIQAIAHQVGYYNVTSFIRWFKQMSGISPGEYRTNKEYKN